MCIRDSTIECDTVLMALGFAPTSKIGETLSDICPDISIGDAVETRKIPVSYTHLGPGGCTAALYAKQAGHEVELWEKSATIGGNAFAASQPYFKTDMHALLSLSLIHILKRCDFHLVPGEAPQYFKMRG